MITGTILKNGVIKLFLTGTDPIDDAVLKELNGAHCKLVTENFRLGDKSITGALIIEKPPVEYKQQDVSLLKSDS